MRDVVGYVCLALFIIAAVVAALAATQPRLLSRRRSSGGQVESPAAPEAAPRRSRALVAILAGAAVVFAGLTYFLLVAPTYSATVMPPKQVVASAGSRVPVKVANNGALGGTFRETPTLDGQAIAEVSGDVAAGKTATIDIVLPDDLSAGEHKLEIDGVQFAFTALTPAEYKVGKLKVDPGVVKVKGQVTVSANVKNTGEAAGTYPGVLEADGKQAATAPTEIAGGETVPVSIRFSRSKLGLCRLNVSGSKATVMVVKPVRLGSGTVLENSLGGGGNVLELQNHYPQDAMFCLTSSKSSKQPLLAVYVRGHKNASVSGLRPGSYYVFYSVGKDWNRYTYDFLTSYGRGRFAKPFSLITKQWTTRSVDYGARMIYTTTYTQSTRFRIMIGSSNGKKSAKVVEVSGGSFPAP